MNTTMAFIYALVDPLTARIRYVGCSVDPTRRLSQHIGRAGKEPDSPKNRWVRKLLNQNLQPSFVVLEAVLRGRAKERECYWISTLRTAGIPLLNVTDGGDGVVQAGYAWNYGLTKETDERVAKQSRCQKGILKSTEHRAKLAAVDRTYARGNKWGKPGPYFKGHKHTAQARERMSQIHRQIGSVSRIRDAPYTQERREKLRKAVIGRERGPDGRLL